MVIFSRFFRYFAAQYALLLLDYESTAVAKRNEINGWLRKIKQFRFTAYLIAMAKNYAVNKELSMREQ